MIDRDKLTKLLAMTTSDHDGEALVAMRIANAMLRKAQLTWAEILGMDQPAAGRQSRDSTAAPREDQGAAYSRAAQTSRAWDHEEKTAEYEPRVDPRDWQPPHWTVITASRIRNFLKLYPWWVRLAFAPFWFALHVVCEVLTETAFLARLGVGLLGAIGTVAIGAVWSVTVWALIVSAVQTITGHSVVTRAPLTNEEKDWVLNQIEACWNPPTRANNAQDLLIDIRIDIGRDGIVTRVHVLDEARYRVDPFFRVTADSAVRALRNPYCQPLKLPAEKYEQWKSITLSFNPKDLR